MKKRFIVGLLGYAGVGKDTICTALGFRRVAFADALKRMVDPIAAKLGYDLTDRDQKDQFRPVYVEVGAAARRKDRDFWVKQIDLSNNVFGSFQHLDHTAVTDTRYLNECIRIWSEGGLVVWIMRPGVGPKNGEEERSFREILAWCQEHNYQLPIVNNDSTPEDAANHVLSLLVEGYPIPKL